MRVKLLLNPYYRLGVNDGLPRTDAIYLPPLGIATLTSFLRQHGIDTSQDDLLTRVYHHNRNHTEPSARIHIEKFYEPDRIETFIRTGSESELEKEGEKILSLTATEGFDVFGLSIYETYNRSTIAAALVLAKLIKERHGAHVVMGGAIRDGVVPTMLRTGWIDYRINRDDYGSQGEVNLLNFCRMVEAGQEPRNVAGITYWRDEQLIVNPPATERDGFSRPTFEGLPLELYRKKVAVVEPPWTIHSEEALVLPYFFIRGCPNRCAFCACSTDPFWRAKKPAQVAEDLAFLSEQYATSNFYFLNSGFNPTYRYAEKVCQAIQAEGVRLHWSDCVNVRNLDGRLIREMRRSGASRLVFGMESASPKILSVINKPVDPKEVESMIRLAHEMGIWCELEIICGFPHESELDVDLTIDFISRNHKYLRNVNLFKFWVEGLYRTEPERFGIRFRRDETHRIDLPENKTEFDEVGGLTWEQRVSATEKSFERLHDTQKLLNRDISTQSGIERDEALFLLFLEDSPESLASVHLNRIEALIRSGRADDALAACEEAIEQIRGRSDMHARILCRRGRVYREQGRLDDAAVAYREALDLKPKEMRVIGEAEGGLAETELARGREAEALALYERRIEEADEPEMLADSHLGRIQVLTRSGHTEDALKACEEALGMVRDLPDRHARILCSKAELFRWLGDLDEAADAYLEAIELLPVERGITWKAEQGLAETELARGREGESLALYEKLIREIDEPEALADAHLGRIEALTRSGRADEALEVCEEAFDLAKGLPDKLTRILCSRGHIYLEQGRHDEAAAAYRQVLVLEPADKRAALKGEQGLADTAEARIGVLVRSGRMDEAMDAFEEALDLVRSLPDRHARILCERAELKQKMERHDEAAADYRKAFGLNPADSWIAVEVERGLTGVAETRIDELTKSGRTDEALDACEEALGLVRNLPDRHARILCRRARLNLILGQKKKALEQYSDIREQWADLPEIVANANHSIGRIHSEIGMEALSSGSVECALRHCRQGEECLRAAGDGSHTNTHYLALCLFMMRRCHEVCGDTKEAFSRRREVEALLEAADGDDTFLEELEDLFMRYRNCEAAIDYVREAVKICGTAEGAVEDLAPLWGELVRWYRDQGRFDEAIEWVAEELSRHPGEPILLFHQGECFMEKGDHERAIRSLREAIDIRPKMDWAHFSLGKCLYLAGDYRGALDELESNLAVCRDPLSHFHSWYYKSMAHERMGNREEALACLERAKSYREFAGVCEIPEEKEFLRELEGGE